VERQTETCLQDEKEVIQVVKGSGRRPNRRDQTSGFHGGNWGGRAARNGAEGKVQGKKKGSGHLWDLGPTEEKRIGARHHEGLRQKGGPRGEIGQVGAREGEPFKWVRTGDRLQGNRKKAGSKGPGRGKK